MILLVGSTNDDILYFSSILKNKKELRILNKFPAYTGEVFNQSVMLLKDVYSSYVSGLATSYIIDKYMTILVIHVGEVQSFTDSLKVGDICVARNVILSDVNMSDTTKVSKGQIEGFPQDFPADTEITSSIANALHQRSNVNAIHCTYVARNYHPENKEQIKEVVENDRILGITNETVISSEIGGIALAAKLHDIPYASISVVGRRIGYENSIEDYVKVLEQYTNVGKAVVSVIGEIGRTDIVK